MKKLFSAFFLSVLLTMVLTQGTFALFSDVPVNAFYFEAVERLSNFNIITGDDKGLFRPNSNITREQFAKVSVEVIEGKKDLREYADKNLFKDISADSWSKKYINYLVEKGIIKGKEEGYFFPTDSVTFAEGTTIVLKALNEFPSEGNWPENALSKAKSLGITKDISINANDKLPRYAAAMLLDKVLLYNIKNTNGNMILSDLNTEKIGQDVIVLGNSVTNEKLAEKQIQTDRGIFYLKEGEIQPKLGHKYRVFIYEDTILKVFSEQDSALDIAVESFLDNIIYFKEDGISKNITASEKLLTYYNGAKTTLDKISTNIKYCSTVVLGYNEDKSDFTYMVAFDPIYSIPVFVRENNILKKSIGEINFGLGLPILKDGNNIVRQDIEVNDVLYNVKDLYAKEKYIEVVRKTAEGDITDIKPSKLSPNILQINTKDYSLDKNFDKSKIDVTPGSFKKYQRVKALLSYDGKVLRIVDDTDNFAFVVNYDADLKSKVDDKRETIFNVKLLMTDGKVVSYKSKEDPRKYKGYVVKYTLTYDNYITFGGISYSNYGNVTIDKISRKVNDNYLAENVKLLNVLSNTDNADAVAQFVDWSDLDAGALEGSKVRLLNKSGSFEDINFIVFDDLFNDKSKLAFLKEFPTFSGAGALYSFNYTFYISGQPVTYMANTRDIKVGEVWLATVENGQIKFMQDKAPMLEAKKVEALDSERIKMNGKIHELKKNVQVYYINSTTAMKNATLSDINVNRTYGKVLLAFDKKPEEGGKVGVIVVYE